MHGGSVEEEEEQLRCLIARECLGITSEVMPENPRGDVQGA